MTIKGLQMKPDTETVELYGGDVILKYTDRGHRYQVTYKGKPVLGTVGCTTVTGILDKPQLLGWAANQTNEYWLNSLMKAEKIDELVITSISKQAPLEWRNKRDSAGDLGTLIHAWIETHIKAKIEGSKLPEPPENEQMNRACMDFLIWAQNEKIIFVASEKKIYSLKHNIAGTCDFIYRREGSGKLGIGDIKTSKGIYKDYFLQLSGYQYMLNEEMVYQNATPIYKEMTIVKVGKGTGDVEIKKVDDYQKYAKAFLACSIIYRTMR